MLRINKGRFRTIIDIPFNFLKQKQKKQTKFPENYNEKKIYKQFSDFRKYIFYRTDTADG